MHGSHDYDPIRINTCVALTSISACEVWDVRGKILSQLKRKTFVNESFLKKF